MAQNKIISTFFILFVAVICQAQIPGYMGSRFSIEGDLNVLPSFVNAYKTNSRRVIVKQTSYADTYGYNDYYFSNNKYYQLALKKNKDVKIVTFNLKSTLALNYSISNKKDISLRIDYTRSKFVLHNINESFYNLNKDDYDNDYRRSNSSREGPVLYSDKDQIPYNLLEYNLNLKLYNSNFIAPVGNYFLIGLGYSQATSKYTINYVYRLYNYNSLENSKLGKKEIEAKAHFIKFNFGFFRKKFIKEKMYINYGIEFNHYFLGKYDYKRLLLDTEYQSEFNYNHNLDLEIETNYKLNIGRHIAIDNRYNLKIGIGIIL